MLEAKGSIDELREELYLIIEQKSYDLSDPKIIEASIYINNAIAVYSSLLKLNLA